MWKIVWNFFIKQVMYNSLCSLPMVVGTLWLCLLERWSKLPALFQTIALLIYLTGRLNDEGPFLILSPLSVLDNWKEEMERYRVDVAELVLFMLRYFSRWWIEDHKAKSCHIQWFYSRKVELKQCRQDTRSDRGGSSGCYCYPSTI